MFDFLEKLKAKQDHHKQAIAFSFSLGVTVIIFFIWVSVFFNKIGATTVVVTQEDIAKGKITEASSQSPFQFLKESVAGVSSSVKDLRSFFDKANSVEYRRE